jgi:hypothetical protein
MLQELKDIFSIVNDWLKFAEAKHGGVIAFNGAAIAMLCSVLFEKNPAGSHHLWIYLYLASAVFFTIAVICSLYSFLPLLNNKEIDRKKTPDTPNSIFFGHIRFFTSDPYLALLYGKINGTTPAATSWTEFDKDYANQITVNSKIAYRKFVLFRTSARLTLLGVTIFFIGLLANAINIIYK